MPCLPAPEIHHLLLIDWLVAVGVGEAYPRYWSLDRELRPPYSRVLNSFREAYMRAASLRNR
jgi:hypothetical protein